MDFLDQDELNMLGALQNSYQMYLWSMLEAADILAYYFCGLNLEKILERNSEGGRPHPYFPDKDDDKNQKKGNGNGRKDDDDQGGGEQRRAYWRRQRNTEVFNGQQWELGRGWSASLSRGRGRKAGPTVQEVSHLEIEVDGFPQEYVVGLQAAAKAISITRSLANTAFDSFINHGILPEDNLGMVQEKLALVYQQSESDVEYRAFMALNMLLHDIMDTYVPPPNASPLPFGSRSPFHGTSRSPFPGTSTPTRLRRNRSFEGSVSDESMHSSLSCLTL